MKYFDTHCHLNFTDYDKDRNDIIRKSLEKGVFVINVGTDLKESNRVIEIAKNYKEGVYASIGLHPLYAEGEDFLIEDYKKLAKEEKVVAIGEAGLDYKYIKKKKDKEIQKEVLIKQIELSNKLKLPLILHCRKAHKDLLKILQLQKADKRREQKIEGVLHCFSGSIREAEEYLNLGLKIGINGIIFKMNLKRVIEKIPLEEMLLETDAPFLSPKKSVKRNSPLLIEDIGKEVARIKKVRVEDVANITTKNARRLFRI